MLILWWLATIQFTLDIFIGNLTKEFATKDMGSLNYFWVLKLIRLPVISDLFLSHAKYAQEILQRDKLIDTIWQ